MLRRCSAPSTSMTWKSTYGDLVVPGATVLYRFVSAGSQGDWGYKFTVTPKFPTTEADQKGETPDSRQLHQRRSESETLLQPDMGVALRVMEVFLDAGCAAVASSNVLRALALVLCPSLCLCGHQLPRSVAHDSCDR